jgi:hypothetical protein
MPWRTDTLNVDMGIPCESNGSSRYAAGQGFGADFDIIWT